MALAGTQTADCIVETRTYAGDILPTGSERFGHEPSLTLLSLVHNSRPLRVLCVPILECERSSISSENRSPSV